MAKYERGTARSTASINDELEKIQNSLADKFDRKPSSGEPNQLETNLDMNGNRIYNLPDPQSSKDAVPKDYIDNIALEGLPVNLGTDKVFETVDNALNDLTLEVGDTVRTLGYYVAGDGGCAEYSVVANGTGIEDGGSYHNTINNLQLKLKVVSSSINVKVFGALETEGVDDTDRIQKASDFIGYEGTLIFNSGKTYSIRELSLENKQVFLNGAFFKKYSTTSKGFINYGRKVGGMVGASFDGGGAVLHGNGQDNIVGLRLYGNHTLLTVKNLRIEGVDFYGLSIGGLTSQGDKDDYFDTVIFDNIHFVSERGNTILSTEYSFGFEVFPGIVCKNFFVNNCSSFGKIINKFHNIDGLYISNTSFLHSNSFNPLSSGYCEINDCKNVSTDNFQSTAPISYYSFLLGNRTTPAPQVSENVKITGVFNRVTIQTGESILANCLADDIDFTQAVTSCVIAGGSYREIKDTSGANNGEIRIQGSDIRSVIRFNNTGTDYLSITNCNIESENNHRFNGNVNLSNNAFRFKGVGLPFAFQVSGATSNVKMSNNSIDLSNTWNRPILVSSGGTLKMAGNRLTDAVSSRLRASGSEALTEDIDNTVNGVVHT